MVKNQNTNTKHYSKIDIDQLLNMFAEIETTNNMLEKIYVNATTFKNFRKLSPSIVGAPTMREAHKGIGGKIWTAEIWFDNALKDGQLKLYFSPFVIGEVDKIEKGPFGP